MGDQSTIMVGKRYHCAVGTVALRGANLFLSFRKTAERASDCKAGRFAKGSGQGPVCDQRGRHAPSRDRFRRTS